MPDNHEHEQNLQSEQKWQEVASWSTIVISLPFLLIQNTILWKIDTLDLPKIWTPLTVLSLWAIISLRKKYFWNMWNTVLRRETEPVLTQDGPYKFSRNPAYCLYILMFQTLVLINPSVLNQLIVMTEIIIMNILIHAEEKNLKTLFWDQYKEYTSSVPRWLWLKSFTGQSK